MEIILDDFGLEWQRKDGEIHKADYDDLIAVYENQKEHDKEIRDKAIEEFAEKFIYKAVCSGCSGCTNCYENGKQTDCEDWKSYMEIAEQMKEVRE